MRNFINKIFLASLAVTIAWLPAQAANSVKYCYLPAMEKMANTGFSGAETYDVAIRIADASLAGSSVTHVRVPVVESENVADFKVWASSKLNVKNVGSITVFEPDITSVACTPQNGYIDVALPEAVKIPAEGLYVGYSFTVNKNTSFDERNPIIGSNSFGAKDAYYVHTDSSRPKFEDLSAQHNFTCGIEATIEGNFNADDALVADARELFGVKNETTRGSFTLSNCGVNAIKSVDFTVSVAGISENYTHVFDTPVDAVYGASAIVDYEITAGAESGKFPVEIAVNKVNGQDIDAPAFKAGEALFVSFTPVHKPLYEEYTGTWCGGCTRGLAAMEYFRRNNYDKCITVSFHGGSDIMRIKNMPGLANEYPKVFIDRVFTGDPYHGSGEGPTDPKVMYDIEQIAAQFSPVDIQVQAGWDSEEMNAVEVNATLTFVAQPETNLAINYTLVHDGLTGEGAYWTQSNYDSGSPLIANYPVLCEYKDLPSYIPNFVYDDVAVYNSGRFGVRNSIPAEITIDEAMPYTYSIPLAECISDFDGQTNLIQDKTKLRVIVSVIDISNLNKTLIVNSAVVNVPTEYTAVKNILSEANLVKEEFFNVAGARVAQPRSGDLYIKVSHFDDGSTRSQKVIVK